ncbi:unnamed protein product [Phaedon cochleariae]|uniref:Uncharacterized protein n=1 Tax=Phaedon cochleariae TaxID=80249 RepID=A0A9P0DK27_PHACE|nr:unnamed protein product [Phaedon cochleariae]
MSSIDVEEILRRLSAKFNRIFCDREFVCCVNEDLQVLLRNKNKCCVVVFPVLGPNYLKAVRYQAKIFDLSVFTLGSEQICSIAVCHTEHLIKFEESEEQIMPKREQEVGGSKLRKKRPERPLYVPPAQRRVPAHEIPVQNNVKADFDNNVKIKKNISTIRKETTEKTKVKTINEDKNENFTNIDAKYFESYALEKSFNDLSMDSFLQWKYELSEAVMNSVHFTIWQTFRHCLRKWSLYSCPNPKVLYVLRNHYCLWQPAMSIRHSGYERCANVTVIPSMNFELFDIQCNDNRKMISILVKPIFQKTYEVMLKDIDVFCDFNVLWIRNGILDVESLNSCGEFYYLIRNSPECNDVLMEKIFNYLDSQLDSDQIPETSSSQLDSDQIPETPSDHFERISYASDNTIPLSVTNTVSIEENSVTEEMKKEPFELEKSNLVYTSNSEQFNESDISSLQTNNIMNNVTNLSTSNENMKSSNELDEEKEIMRKAKENINRKTRPIMKYVEANNTLKIDKNENVNHWEDLFDEHGHLQEDLLKEIVHKVGSDVTIVKAKEDYSDYFTKQIEELEHMVELFDFPSTFETHDLIQAFSDIKSEAMYVKWVDDTHALLVLGSLSQAQKAISIGHPLINVRPMTAASRESLATAYKHDLRPAMKRPQTNLQTARRLITSHLGTKTSVSKERSAKERDDLRAAKEMKKLVKKNEQDAWEGNLRSSKTK